MDVSLNKRIYWCQNNFFPFRVYPSRAKSCILELTPVEKGGSNENGRVGFL